MLVFKEFFRECEKKKCSKTWEKYRKQINYINKLKKKSVNNYFQERCVGSSKSDTFGKLLSRTSRRKTIVVIQKIF